MLINFEEKRLGNNKSTKTTAVILAGASMFTALLNGHIKGQNTSSGITTHASADTINQKSSSNLTPQVQAQIKQQYGFDAVKAVTNKDNSLTLYDKDGASLTISTPQISSTVKDVTAETNNDPMDKIVGNNQQNNNQGQQDNQNNSQGNSNKNVNLNLPDNLSSVRQKIVDLAKSQLGVPYVWGGTAWGKGMDCSGFVQQVYKQVGINLPRTSQQQTSLLRVIPLNQAKPGDLVFWGGKGTAYHIAIYVGNNQVIEEPNPSQPCHLVHLYGNYQIGTLDGVNK